jgi:hypothetical protein
VVEIKTSARQCKEVTIDKQAILAFFFFSSIAPSTYIHLLSKSSTTRTGKMSFMPDRSHLSNNPSIKIKEGDKALWGQVGEGVGWGGHQLSLF